MKHVIIGDLHGKDIWKKVDADAFEKIVFLGDYVDAKTIADSFIISNLEAIIEFKKSNRSKVELLLGNHDIQYLYYPNYINDGFNAAIQQSLSRLFNDNKSLFAVAYQKDKYLFTHAGVTNSWYKDFIRLSILPKIRDQHDTLADLLNKVDHTGQRYLLHAVGRARKGKGDGGITWADREETMVDMLDGFHQVVGHTKVPAPETTNKNNSSVTYIDVLNVKTYFHELDI